VSIRLSPVSFYNKDTPFCWIFQVLILQAACQRFALLESPKRAVFALTWFFRKRIVCNLFARNHQQRWGLGGESRLIFVTA